MSHPPKISRDAITTAALAIIDADGPGNLSIGAIAERLGVRGPSLYHHFENKAEILSAVVRHVVLQTPVIPYLNDADWQRWLVEQSIVFRRTILHHPNVAPLVFEYFPRESIAFSYDRASKTLELAGVPKNLHLLIFEGIDRITLGSALYAAIEIARAGSDNTSIPASSIPGRAAAMAVNGWDEEELFVQLLTRFLRGVMPAGKGRQERLAKSRPSGVR